MNCPNCGCKVRRPRKTGGGLSTLRKNCGLNQGQLSEILNVSRQTISNWEVGLNKPNLTHLMQLKDVLSVPTLDELIAAINTPSEGNVK